MLNARDLVVEVAGPDAFCPAPLSGGIQLTFFARVSGAPLAVAQGPVFSGYDGYGGDRVRFIQSLRRA